MSKPLQLTSFFFLVSVISVSVVTAFFDFGSKSMVLDNFTATIRNELIQGNNRRVSELVYSNCKLMELGNFSYKSKNEKYEISCDENHGPAFNLTKHLFYDSKNTNYFATIVFRISINSYIKKVLAFSIGLFIIHIFFFFRLQSFLLKRMKTKVDAESNRMNALLARKLAHDIRSPLSTLNLISSKITNDSVRNLQLQVISQINLIAENLLTDTLRRQFLLKAIISSTELDIESKKRFYKREITVTNTLSKIHLSHYIPAYLNVHITNLLQNAIEATVDGDKIVVSFSSHNDYLVVKVTDSGVGIPVQLVNKIGDSEFSFDPLNSKRQSGNGIAILNLKSDLEKLGGRLEITSEPNCGCEIKLLIPLG